MANDCSPLRVHNCDKNVLALNTRLLRCYFVGLFYPAHVGSLYFSPLPNDHLLANNNDGRKACHYTIH